MTPKLKALYKFTVVIPELVGATILIKLCSEHSYTGYFVI
jgi:hypothetical protein